MRVLFLQLGLRHVAEPRDGLARVAVVHTPLHARSQRLVMGVVRPVHGRRTGAPPKERDRQHKCGQEPADVADAPAWHGVFVRLQSPSIVITLDVIEIARVSTFDEQLQPVCSEKNYPLFQCERLSIDLVDA